jgi:hypothetical protein
VNPFTKYYSGDLTRKNEVGGACDTYVRNQRYIEGFGGEI